MAKRSILVDFAKIRNVPGIIDCLEPAFRCELGDVINIEIIIRGGMIYPEYLLTIVGAVKFLESKGIEGRIAVDNKNEYSYASRINFYEELGVDYAEKFKRHNSAGRFVEITGFNESNSVEITNKIMRVVKNNWINDLDLLGCLNYCFFEMVDNIQLHAKSPIGGYTVVQNYKKNKELRIALMDTGVGIYEALTKTEGTKYSHLSEKEAVESCIKERVTNGKGRGNGLFHTAQFMLNNKGEMKLYSGNYYIDIDNGKVNIRKGAYWQGTFIYIKMYTDNRVQLASIFGENIPTSVEEAIDCIEELW